MNVFEIAEEPEKKPSSYDSGYYYPVELFATNEQGEHFEMKKNFKTTHDTYHSFLRALGGRTQANNVTLPPNATRFKGKKFEADIIHIPKKNDKSTMTHDLVNITPYKEEAQTPVENTSESSKVDDDEVPF